jgi:23S rRNA (guanosine2251-2'-O)-methyltransferase
LRELVYGWHAAASAFARGGVSEIWIQDNRRDGRAAQLQRQARQAGVAVHRESRRVLDQMAEGARHQGVVVACVPQQAATPPDLTTRLESLDCPAFLLVLDQVQDPHNLGACLRSADAAGVHGVVAPRDRAAGMTPVVRKVACGAAETVPLFPVTNLARTLRTLQDQGVRVVGTAAEADRSLFDVDLTGPVALVLGGEEKGLRRLTREQCDELIRIPMAGVVESLNVSVAAAVCLFEARRQRGRGGRDCL